MKILLQNMVDDLRFEELPPTWNTFDLENFSNSKKLWDYQQKALENALKTLWKYYVNFANYNENELLDINKTRKELLFNWYLDNGLEEDLDINITNNKRNIYKLLENYYPVENNKISYKHFINRMSFWMATGSGKSLVIVKLIEVLMQLIERSEIPPNDILILTHRDDLIEQLRKHVDEYNTAHDVKIILEELKKYAEVKMQRVSSGHTVFYYRSDNLSDEQKDKIIDFKNYDNNGKWYIFLDEAHKGDKEDSKRQHIYSVLSRNGFLFNFSATFIDPRDIITCAFEFNLSSYIQAGYGKHISILEQEIRAFRDKEDYNREEKEKIVLKSLILLTYVKKFYEQIENVQPNLYHKPLLLVLVNSVNTKDADLKLFFRELEKIGKGTISPELIITSIEELLSEFSSEPKFVLENTTVRIDKDILKSITKDDILKYVFNATGSGEIEVLSKQSDKKELAFKLKTSDQPFALIKIGDITQWLNEELTGYEIQERFEDETYFENLNREESDINILLGSRSFYEGWDSNRPNVIDFINIGMGDDAKKFILQSIGRGVRIEPIKNKRKRLQQLYNAGDIEKSLFDKLQDKIEPLETLFVFGTNRDAIVKVVQELESESKLSGETVISLYENPDVPKTQLLVPKYKPVKATNTSLNRNIKFEISDEELELLSNYINFLTDNGTDNRLLLMKYNTDPQKIRFLHESLRKKDNVFTHSEKNYKNLDLLVQRFFDFLNISPEDVEEFKTLNDEIKHFKNIKVYLGDINNEIKEKIEDFAGYSDLIKKEEYLKEKLRNNEIDLDTYTELIKEYNSQTVEGETIQYKIKKGNRTETREVKIKYIANNYYFPVILSDEEKSSYFKYIITTKSEIDFINDLSAYVTKPNNRFKNFDWWFFSKINENVDDIYIPYYDPNTNSIRKFYPDFIFWLKKDNDYFIVFADPKGTEHINAYRKIDGYREVFTEGNDKVKIFNYNRVNVQVRLFFIGDTKKAIKNYETYWASNIDEMLQKLF